MKIDTNLSPSALRLVLVGGGAALSYATWLLLSGMILDFRYEPVFGEQIGDGHAIASAGSYSLPIVQASKDKSDDTTYSAVTDDMIEAAFKEPQIEVVEEKAEVAPLSIGTLFMLTHRPVVGGLAGNGIFLNGGYWRLNESITSLPVRGPDGRIHHPTLASISKKEIKLAFGDEAVIIPMAMF